MTNQNFWDSNAWDNGSWIRTEGDIQINNRFLEERKARHRQDQEAEEQNRQAREAELRQCALEYSAARRKRIMQAPARAMKQYQNAIRKIGLMAVSEALGS